MLQIQKQLARILESQEVSSSTLKLKTTPSLLGTALAGISEQATSRSAEPTDTSTADASTGSLVGSQTRSKPPAFAELSNKVTDMSSSLTAIMDKLEKMDAEKQKQAALRRKRKEGNRGMRSTDRSDFSEGESAPVRLRGPPTSSLPDVTLRQRSRELKDLKEEQSSKPGTLDGTDN
jgi:hypothetical protein